jgi:hypothetical protein
MIAYAFLQHRRLAATARKKKESTVRRLSQLCPPCATPSSNSSLDYRRSDARIVKNGFAASSGVSKSAKVVLGRVLINAQIARFDCPKKLHLNHVAELKGPLRLLSKSIRLSKIRFISSKKCELTK